MLTKRRPLTSHKADAGLSILPPARKTKKNPLLISMMLILASALGAALFWQSYSSSEPAVVAAKDIEQGTIIQVSDLRMVETRAEGQINQATSVDLVAGKIAAVDIAQGDIISPQSIGRPIALPNNTSLIAVLLNVGQYPPQLHSGDRVTVFSVDAATSESFLAADNIVVHNMTSATSEVSDESKLIVSLEVSDTQAAAVAAATKSQESVRLALRGKQ